MNKQSKPKPKKPDPKTKTSPGLTVQSVQSLQPVRNSQSLTTKVAMTREEIDEKKKR